MKARIIAIATMAASAALPLMPGAASAQPYPAKPIRLIVPFTPSGGTDASARILAQALTDDAGWRFVVENRPGASGRIGTELAAKAPADGYTLLVGSVAPNAIIPSAVSNLPYDAVRDFAPISLLVTSDFILAVHPSLPARSVKDMVALARSKPGEINFSSVGNISGSHMTGELLKQLAKINIVHVAYKGPGAAVIAVLSGEVSFYFGSGPTLTPHANAGRLRLLASTGSKRSQFNPGLPTVSETVPGHESTQWFGILAPAGTSKEIISKLHGAIAAAARTPKVVEQFAAVGSESIGSSPAEFAAFIKAEMTKWGKVVKSGVSLE
jgi:tripartite-type tricarboxylate transporter receptor subunit TctC